MAILRSGFLVALNDLISALGESANRARSAAGALGDGSVARALNDLADARLSAADGLADIVEAEDDIPSAPPEEREVLENVALHAEAALSGDEARELLAACRGAEAAVVAAADEVLGQAKDDGLRARIRGLRQDAASRVAEIAAGNGVELED